MISLVVTTIVMYILCKHTNLKSLVTSLALQQIKGVGAVANQELVSIAKDIECICKNQWYTIFMLCLSILGIEVLYNILLPINCYIGSILIYMIVETMRNIKISCGYFIRSLGHFITPSIASDLLDISNPHEYADICYQI